MPFTKTLMTASAAILILTGFIVGFAPEELAALLGMSAAQPVPVMLKLMGALYLGFGMMDWMARSNMIGGIYARPVAVGNFLHFAVGAIVLAKHQLGAEIHPILLGTLLVYLAFGVGFGWLVFGQGAACAVAREDTGG